VPIKVLCSHFTYVNFDSPVPINSKGEVFWGNIRNRFSLYDYGTFEEERKYVYKGLLGENKINLTLSGHSHRSGLYTIEEVKSKGWSKAFQPLTNSMPNKLATLDHEHLVVKGHGPCMESHVYNNVSSDRCNILVSGCGGPIAVQNLEGELHHWGLDYPSGSFIQFSEQGVNRIERVIPDLNKVPTAKPRLSVALDFADILNIKYKNERAQGGVFAKFESGQEEHVFEVEISKGLKLPISEPLIKRLTLQTESNTIKSEAVILANEKYLIRFNRNELIENFSRWAKKNETPIIKIEFDSWNSKNNTFQHYQIDHWQFPIEILSKKEVAKKLWEKQKRIMSMSDPKGMLHIPRSLEQQKKAEIEATKGYIINRHRRFGEVPNLIYYYKEYPHEYCSPEMDRYSFG
jgi:hypothetical protein